MDHETRQELLTLSLLMRKNAERRAREENDPTNMVIDPPVRLNGKQEEDISGLPQAVVDLMVNPPKR